MSSHHLIPASTKCRLASCQAASAQLRDRLAQAEAALRRMRVVTKSIGLARRLDGLRAENVELKLRAPSPPGLPPPGPGLRRRAQQLTPAAQRVGFYSDPPATHSVAGAGDAAVSEASAASPARASAIAQPTEPHLAAVSASGMLQRSDEAPAAHAAREGGAMVADSPASEHADVAQALHADAPPPRTRVLPPPPEPASSAAPSSVPTTPSGPAAAPAAAARAPADAAAGDTKAGTTPEMEVRMLRVEVRERDERLRACRAELAEREAALWVQRRQLEVWILAQDTSCV